MPASRPDPASLSRAAKRQAEEKRAAVLKRARLAAFKKHKDGTYALRKDIGASNQIAIPASIVRRWGGVGSSVIILDLEWAVLIVPQDEARVLFTDLRL